MVYFNQLYVCLIHFIRFISITVHRMSIYFLFPRELVVINKISIQIYYVNSTGETHLIKDYKSLELGRSLKKYDNKTLFTMVNVWHTIWQKSSLLTFKKTVIVTYISQMSLQSFVYYPLTSLSKEELFLQYFFMICLIRYVCVS